MAGDVAWLHLRVFADPAVPVAAADAAGEGFQDDAVRFAERIRDAFQAQGLAVGAKDGGAHQDLR
jgi:hypothetical protein